MAKRLTVLISDDLYTELVTIREMDETLALMDLVRVALRLLIWYHRQRKDGFTVCARKDEGGKEIVREIVIQGTS